MFAANHFANFIFVSQRLKLHLVASVFTTEEAALLLLHGNDRLTTDFVLQQLGRVIPNSAAVLRIFLQT